MATKAPPSAKVSDVIEHFAPVRKFAPTGNQKQYSITSIDFDDTGELCLVSQDDDTLQIYNCKEGKHAKELKSQKYGVDLAKFTHHSQSIIYASTKVDDGIRYLSSHDNSYIRYFRGHTGPVTCLALSPASDTFLSASLDETVRLWDLRSAAAQGQLNLHAPHLVAYDPTATVMAVASPAAGTVLLYDARNYDKAPFSAFDLRPAERALAGRAKAAPGAAAGAWTRLEFSNDGRRLLLATGGAHHLLDAFEGDARAHLARPTGGTGRLPPGPELGAHRARAAAGRAAAGALGVAVGGAGDACFSPDGRFVVGGSGEFGLCVWDTALEGERGGAGAGDGAGKLLPPVADLGTQVAGTCAVVAFNPRHNVLATADRALVLWLPDDV